MKMKHPPVRDMRIQHAQYLKRNPNDATFRNITALKKRVTKLEQRLAKLTRKPAKRTQP